MKEELELKKNMNLSLFKMTVFKQLFIAILALLLLSELALAGVAQVKGFRMWASPDSTRLVIDLSKKVSYLLTKTDKPERVIIDIEQVQLATKKSQISFKNGAIKTLRSAKKKNNKLRLVLDLRENVKPKSFLLKPNSKYGYRLVIDLEKIVPRSRYTPPKIIKSVNSSKKRDLIVAIDAGHGGDDPGALGPQGTQEKKVVLSIARKLRDIVNKTPGMKAKLIRNGDYYISLRGRTKKARKLNADVFISIHADAFKNPKAKGASVFILSSRGASSEAAKWLAKKENDADLVGGVSLDDKDDMLAKMLLDLSQTATIEASTSVASRVLRGLKKVAKTHKPSVERAGFVVLKSPDIPSILVETGFISNPREEKLLRTSSYQKKLAQAIFNGVNSYFKQYPTPGTVYAKDLEIQPLNNSIAGNTKKHKVARGDTLSAISRRYRVSVTAIKKANKLKSNTLYLGKVLHIPRS